MSIKKSESVGESTLSTREQALATAMQRIQEAYRGSTPSSPNSASRSSRSISKRSEKPVITNTIAESGEGRGKSYVPAHVKSLSTAKLAALKNDDHEDSEYALVALTLRADNGDEEAFAAISADFEHIYSGLSIMGRSLLKSMVKSFVGQDRRLTHILIANDVVECRDKLAGPNPTALEALLAERVAICQATLDSLECLYFQADQMSISLSLIHQGRISMVHSRLVQAVKALAQVRKLQLPNVQVNIGDKQVNVA